MLRDGSAKLWRLVRHEIRATVPIYLLILVCVGVLVYEYWTLAALWYSGAVSPSLTVPLTWIDTHANLILVVITGIYAALTYGLLRESKATRLAALSSEVVVDLEEVKRDRPILECVVRNIGRAPATNILLDTDPPMLDPSGKAIVPLRIAGLGPGHQRRYVFGQASTYLREALPRTYHVTVSWTDSAAGATARTSIMDVGSYEVALFESHPSGAIAKPLETIARSLHGMRVSRSLRAARPLSGFEKQVLEQAKALNESLDAIAKDIRRTQRRGRVRARRRSSSPSVPLLTQPEAQQPVPSDGAVADLHAGLKNSDGDASPPSP